MSLYKEFFKFRLANPEIPSKTTPDDITLETEEQFDIAHAKSRLAKVQEELKNLKLLNKFRIAVAVFVLILTTFWLIYLMVVVGIQMYLHQGLQIWELIGLMVDTTVGIIGLPIIVLKFFFNNHDQK